MSRARIKVCGITNLKDLEAAVACGANAVGFIFATSPRRITPQTAAGLCAEVPLFVTKVGVFMDQDPEYVTEVYNMCGLDCVQLHGDETKSDIAFLKAHGVRTVIKAIRLEPDTDVDACNQMGADAFLIDSAQTGSSAGGTGTTADWELARKFIEKSSFPVLLAGGLEPDNIGKAISVVNAFAFDVCSGVEKQKGIKDEQKLKALFENANSPL